MIDYGISLYFQYPLLIFSLIIGPPKTMLARRIIRESDWSVEPVGIDRSKGSKAVQIRYDTLSKLLSLPD